MLVPGFVGGPLTPSSTEVPDLSPFGKRSGVCVSQRMFLVESWTSSVFPNLHRGGVSKPSERRSQVQDSATTSDVGPLFLRVRKATSLPGVPFRSVEVDTNQPLVVIGRSEG